MPFTLFLAQWQAFFSTLTTACATLIGLLFVAMTLSVNTLSMEENAQLMRVARDTLGHFLVVLMSSIMFLVPALPPYGLALALFIIAVPWTIGAARRFASAWRNRKRSQFAATLLQSSGLSVTGGIGLTVVGVLVCLEAGAALYVLVGVFAMLLAAATGTAWFLLSQLRRVPR